MEQPRKSHQNRARWDMDKVRYHLDHPLSPKRDIKSLAEVLKDVVEGIDQPVQANVLLLREAWPELTGSQIATHSRPGFIKDNALHVFVDHPGWLAELERMKRALLLKIQTNYRDLNIRNIRLLLDNG